MNKIPMKEGIKAMINFAVPLIGSFMIITRIKRNKEAQAS